MQKQILAGLVTLSLISCSPLDLLIGLDNHTEPSGTTDVSSDDVGSNTPDSPNTPDVPVDIESPHSTTPIATEPKSCSTIALESTFDMGSDMWQVVGDAEGGGGAPDYVTTGGNPGGYISADDDAAGGTWYWSAPLKFLGNQSGAYGKTLSFDLKQSSTSSQFDNTDLIIEGNGITLALDLSSNPDTDWTAYSVRLDTSSDWKHDSLEGATASAEEIKMVLGSLDRLWIRGEYVDGRDTGGLDNVRMLSNACATTGQSSASGSVVSSFSMENDGWLVVGDAEGGGGEPDYVTTGGNPGGYLSADDDAAGGTWYWSAPEKFLKDQSRAYGKTLSFDLKQSSTSSQFDNTDLILEGNGITLALDLSSNPDTDWTAYSVRLDSSSDWKHDSLEGATTSAEEIKMVLSSLDRLWIRGEYVDGRDTGGLDNVVLER